MAADYGFEEEDMVIHEASGYPKAYARICKDYGGFIYNRGPPFTFTPYSLQQNEILRANELEQMFPVIDPKAKPTSKPKLFLSLLWKQLNHLGNAGFDPAVIRVDSYGNVLYYHADSASPLAWKIDHWFPCSRGGLTVPSNLRIIQWQAFKNKHGKLEFLIPWWDLQVGVPVNQFLSIFAASNSDFRRRAFSFLFKDGESEELNGSQSVDSHCFPQHFVESKEKSGLAPAAMVVSRRESYESSLILRSLDYNSQMSGLRKRLPGASKENENPDFVTNPYQAIVAARDSLKQKQESNNLRAEMKKLDSELNEISKKNDEDRLTIQELELQLIKRRRRAEKCRRVAESQSSYRTMLEKMIRDAMHQSVVYKEQLRLNQAATSSLMARLEAQKAMCDSSEKELHKKFKERDELENQIRPENEQARKRSRLSDDNRSLLEDMENRALLCLPGTTEQQTPSHKELRLFLEEEQKAYEAKLDAGSSKNENDQRKHGEIEEFHGDIDERIENFRFRVLKEDEVEEDEEHRRERGKGNVEKWLQILLEKNEDEQSQDHLSQIENQNEETTVKKDAITEVIDARSPLKQSVAVKNNEITEAVDAKNPLKQSVAEEKIQGSTQARTENGSGSRKSLDERKRCESNGKERAPKRSESARTFRRIPSSPSLILGMKKGVDCIRKKPPVRGDDDDEEEEYLARNGFLKSSMKSIKKAMKF